MSGYQDRLQGKVRLARIHRIRLITTVALASATLLFAFATMVAAGASLLPLFLPIPEAIQIALLMGLIALVARMYFQNLELKASQSESQRYLMTKTSMARAKNMAAMAFLLAALLLVPGAAGLAGDLFSEAPRPVSLRGWETQEIAFASPDAFGISHVRRIDVSVTNGMVQVLVERNNRSVALVWGNATDRISILLRPDDTRTYANWTVFIRNVDNLPASVTFALLKGVWPALFSFVPFLLLLIGVANIGWWIGLRPIRERTKSAGVYGGSVEPGVQVDERLYIEYATAPARDQIPPAPPVAAAAPPPPPRMPPPPPPEILTPAAPAPLPKHEAKPAAPRVESAQTFTERGDVLLQAGAAEAALSAYEAALRLDAAYVPSLKGKAASYERMGNRAAALDMHRRILQIDRRDAVAARSAADVLIAERRWREALEVVDDALRLRPNDPGFLERRGDILTNLGRRAEALGSYESALAMDPRNDNVRQKIEEVRVDVPGLMSRALIASASGNYPHALTLFDDILEVEPGNVNALIGKAVAYRRSHKPQEALNCLDLVLNLQPGNVAAILNRGHILLEEDDLDAALETFDRLVQLSPGDEEAWVGQGDVLVRMGRDDDALAAYAQALKLSPGDEETLAKIHELEAARSVPADVMQDLYRVRGVGPAKARALAAAGFRTPQDFAKATIEDLTAVKGITRKLAIDLLKKFKPETVEAK